MRTVLSSLLAVLLLSPAAPGQDREEAVSWEEEERAAIRGPRLGSAADPPQPLEPAPAGMGRDSKAPAPQLQPLPEFETSAWSLVFPGACLALVAVNVGWRRKRRPAPPPAGGSDA